MDAFVFVDCAAFPPPSQVCAKERVWEIEQQKKKSILLFHRITCWHSSSQRCDIHHGTPCKTLAVQPRAYGITNRGKSCTDVTQSHSHHRLVVVLEVNPPSQTLDRSLPLFGVPRHDAPAVFVVRLDPHLKDLKRPRNSSPDLHRRRSPWRGTRSITKY